ncbi:VTT domain-containing protein [Metabacillus sp. KIGAM252]|uniref:VTT domain-containing protein n=1 Tax=Metabacillus flavus TaxID=2823519 RepID=A0ABS5LIB2_9BACI|nr:VTT domain-containing protein [Metabacillus flavus]MBS2970490.1 VTT domain-containing protein [Metabacillus flavus]
MFEFVIKVLKLFGIWGLLGGIAIEASSVPFPGSLLTLAYGFVLDQPMSKMIWIAVLASIVYTIFSLIPYWIGAKLEHKVKKKFKRKKKTIERTQRWFKKCGIWSIALSRPLGIGNYISYVSGLSKVKLTPFLILTFIGVFPLNIAMLWLGSAGNLGSVQKFMSNMQTVILILLGIALAGYLIYRFFIKKKNCDDDNQAESSSV